MRFENQNILITGGAGFIGAHLARALAAGNRVTLFDNLSSGSFDAVRDLTDSGRARLVRGDITLPSGLADVCDGADVVFHLAVLNVRDCLIDPAAARAVNVEGTRNVCVASSRAGAQRFIYVSSSDIYGDVDTFPTSETCEPRPTNAYGATKLEAERIVEQMRRGQDFPALIVRPFNTYGPGEHVTGTSGEMLPRFVFYALSDVPPPVFGQGRQSRSFTYIDDTVRGILAAAACGTLPDTPVNIAHPVEVTIFDAARLVLEMLGKTELGFQFHPARPGDVPRQVPDVSLAEKLFGFRALTTLRQGLPHLIEYMKSRVVALEDVPLLWRAT